MESERPLPTRAAMTVETPYYRFMSPQFHPAIPFGTTDLSCGKCAEDLICRLYAADEMTCHAAISR